MSKFFHDNDNGDVKVIAIPWVFSENSRAKNMHLPLLNALPNDKILDQSELKAFADIKLKVTQMAISFLDRTEKVFFNVFKRLLLQGH